MEDQHLAGGPASALKIDSPEDWRFRGGPAALEDSSSVETGRASPGGRRETGFIVVGYRGTFAFGRDGGIADVKFRKLWRILRASPGYLPSCSVTEHIAVAHPDLRAGVAMSRGVP